MTVVFTLRNGVGFGTGFQAGLKLTSLRPVTQRSGIVGNYSFGGPTGPYGAYGTRIGVSTA